MIKFLKSLFTFKLSASDLNNRRRSGKRTLCDDVCM